MSKFIIVFCITLATSVTYGATLEKRQEYIFRENVKNLCIRIIHQTFSDAVDMYISNHSENHEENKGNYLVGLMSFMKNGAVAVDNLIKELNEIELISEERRTSIAPGSPISCDERVLNKLSNIKSRLLDEASKNQ